MDAAQLIVVACLLGACPVEAQETYSVEDHKGSGVKFMRPDGTPIFVNPRAVAFVRAPLRSEGGNATIVFSSGATQSVQETVEQVIEAIHADMPYQPIPEEGP